MQTEEESEALHLSADLRTAIVRLCWITLLCGVLIGANLCSCSGSSTAPPPPLATPSANLTGEWAGFWNSEAAPQAFGVLWVEITQQGNDLRGDFTAENSACVSAGEVVGTIAKHEVLLCFDDGTQLVEFDGEEDLQGEYLRGIYIVTGGACNGDHGFWTLTKVHRR